MVISVKSADVIGLTRNLAVEVMRPISAKVVRQAEQIALTHITVLPMFLSKSDIAWLKIRLHDHRPAVKQAAIEAYNTRFQK